MTSRKPHILRLLSSEEKEKKKNKNRKKEERRKEKGSFRALALSPFFLIAKEAPLNG